MYFLIVILDLRSSFGFQDHFVIKYPGIQER